MKLFTFLSYLTLKFFEKKKKQNTPTDKHDGNFIIETNYPKNIFITK